MDITKQGTINLIKSALTGTAYPLPKGYDLEAEYPILKKHHMDSLLYDGAVRCGISSHIPVMKVLFQQYCRNILINEGQQQQITRLLNAFEEQGIDYMPLKGCRMMHLYPKPEFRSMGDVDILIRTEQYPEIKSIMLSLGFEEQEESDYDFHWKHPKLNAELHKQLSPFADGDLCEYFGTGWQRASHHNGHYWSMSAEDEWIYLFGHFTKHFRGSGIGCRHLVDLAVYLRSHTNMDTAYIRSEMKKLQLLEFYENICNTIKVWFEDAAPDEKTLIITEYIYSCGSWGNMQNLVLSKYLQENGIMSDSENRIAYLWRAVFPRRTILESQYPIIIKVPLLLPVIWAYRLVDKLLFQQHKLRKVRHDMDTVTAEKLTERKQLLNSVGLKS